MDVAWPKWPGRPNGKPGRPRPKSQRFSHDKSMSTHSTELERTWTSTRHSMETECMDNCLIWTTDKKDACLEQYIWCGQFYQNMVPLYKIFEQALWWLALMKAYDKIWYSTLNFCSSEWNWGKLNALFIFCWGKNLFKKKDKSICTTLYHNYVCQTTTSIYNH